jgi:hypothetical protein
MFKRYWSFRLYTLSSFCQVGKIYDGLEKEDVERFIKSKCGSEIRMKDGTRYITIAASDSARGHKFKQVYVSYEIDIKILNNVILPLVELSDLPREERVIEY